MIAHRWRVQHDESCVGARRRDIRKWHRLPTARIEPQAVPPLGLPSRKLEAKRSRGGKVYQQLGTIGVRKRVCIAAATLVKTMRVILDLRLIVVPHSLL